ncbi:vacuolar protein-sorting-associated protein [Canna indica]|uniref:Vacuolar protein-sorting-associated protein n=1 Tax=Canna indica TaxID=4628 RepID=A0AAQ3JN82_9LILI|nr:vacuolar protein-sorting-associated protein [Canna indica]
MAGLSHRLTACLHTGQLALVAILVSGGIVLQILVSIFSTSVFYSAYVTAFLSLLMSIAMFEACALYNNWWPMLTALMYVILPMPLLFFMGSNSSSLVSSEGNGWVNFTKFLTGFSVVGSIAIPSILKHANIIGWGALSMELSSFAVFGVAILLYLQMNNLDDYSYSYL